MHWILEFIVKNRNVCSLLLTVILSLWMISGSPEKQARTARTLTVTFFYPLQITFNQFLNIKNIFSENRRLKQDIASLNVRLASLKEQVAENDRLRGLLGFSKDFTYDLIPVRVIARDPSPVLKSIVVNAGRKNGVGMWMPLVGENGVAGKVIQVMNGLSLVQLLKDPSNRTSVMSCRTRTVSILETENGSDYFIRYRSHEDIEIGDTIVTSGLGGIYPRGLRVGEVKEISDSQSPLFKRVWLDLAVDFEHVEELFVIKLTPQWAAFRAEFDSLRFDNE